MPFWEAQFRELWPIEPRGRELRPILMAFLKKLAINELLFHTIWQYRR